MDPDALDARVAAPVDHHESLPSTNDVARQHGRSGDPHGTLVVADEQTAGRGRTGNVWASPPGGVWSSTLLRPDFSPAHVGRLTFAGGLAAAETVESFGVEAGLKWPNDVLVPVSNADDGNDGSSAPKKIAGVLTEAVVDEVPVAGKPVDEVLPGTDPESADLSFVVMGIGVNANLSPDDLETDREVATLRDERGEPVDLTEVAATLHGRLLHWADVVETDAGFAEALDAWRERSVTLGERVRVQVRGHDVEPVVGTATRVTETGALVVDTTDGEIEVTEGECERLRPV